LIVGESDSVAKKNLRDVSWNLQNNQLLRMLFPEIIPPDFNKVIWRDDEIEINRPKSFDEGSIKTVGVGAKTTGFHHDIIIYDDMIGEKASKSEAEMEAAKHWFVLAPGLANDQHTVEELIVGTRWKHGTADIYGYIMEEMAFSEESGRPSGFKWRVKSCYDSEGNVRFWPRFDEKILAAILHREKIYKFSCQYLNDPTAPEGSKFTEDQIKLFRIEERLDASFSPTKVVKDLIVPLDGTPPVRLAHLARLSFYDPSAGGPTAKSENAIACVGTAPDGRKFVFKVWSQFCGFRAAIEMWFRLNDQFITWPNFFEGVGPHKEVAQIVVERQQLPECKVCLADGKKIRHRRLSPVLVTPPGGSASKEERILTFAQSDIEDGLVYLFEHDIQTKKQILEFPNGKLLDRFDAMAYAVHYSKKPHSPEEVEAEQYAQKQKEQVKQQRTAQTYEVGGYI
jgi:hypothetical protein